MNALLWFVIGFVAGATALMVIAVIIGGDE